MVLQHSILHRKKLARRLQRLSMFSSPITGLVSWSFINTWTSEIEALQGVSNHWGKWNCDASKKCAQEGQIAAYTGFFWVARPLLVQVELVLAVVQLSTMCLQSLQMPNISFTILDWRQVDASSFSMFALETWWHIGSLLLSSWACLQHGPAACPTNLPHVFLTDFHRASQFFLRIGLLGWRRTKYRRAGVVVSGWCASKCDQHLEVARPELSLKGRGLRMRQWVFQSCFWKFFILLSIFYGFL